MNYAFILASYLACAIYILAGLEARRKWKENEWKYNHIQTPKLTYLVFQTVIIGLFIINFSYTTFYLLN